VPGLGTLINVVAVLIGATIGVLVGHRLPQRTRSTITDALGLVTGVIAALNLTALGDDAFADAVGADWTLLVVLGALVIGGITGSLLNIESRLEGLGGWLQTALSRGRVSDSRERFIEGFVTASLVFCIGPLAILGAISDGLGNGIDQLVLKSALDLFAGMAFAATLGWGVAASALAVGVLQGSVTLAAVMAGSFMPDALVASITATGGILLLGIALRLLQLRQVAVGDLLPALVVAPVLTAVVSLWT
jgi:uncharacterized protein